MNDLFRGLAAAGCAKWVGGGLVTSAIVFLIVWSLLGTCQS
jgi:hypothetical protein